MKNDGGPAFPHTASWVNGGGHRMQESAAGSLTLRDYFAAKAMQAYLSTYPCPAAEDNEPQPEMVDLAADAYAVADAMLKAREQ